MSQFAHRTTHAVFLSYAREDLALAKALAAALEDCGLSVAMDVASIVPGDEWQDRLDQLLRGSAKVVFLATPSSARSDACDQEIRTAQKLGKPILPVLPAGIEKSVIPVRLSSLHYTRLPAADDLPSGLVALSEAIRINIDWERRKAAYLLRSEREGAVLHEAKELDEAEAWAMSRPADAAPIPLVVADMLRRSRARLAQRSRRFIAVLGSIAVILAVLGTLAVVQWQRQIQATRTAEIEAALRSSGPALEYLGQGRQLDALTLLRQAVGTLEGTGPVGGGMHVALRHVLRQVAGQSRYPIDDDLVAFDMGGRLILQDPNSGMLQALGPGGLRSLGSRLKGRILSWEEVPALAQGIVARQVGQTLVFHAFDPSTGQSGPDLARLELGEPAAATTVETGPDGLVLVRSYATSTTYFYEGTYLTDPVATWTVDLSSGLNFLLSKDYDLLLNDRHGRSYVLAGREDPVLRYDPASRQMLASPQPIDVRGRDAFYTCFRHDLQNPDLELMIDRMGESPEDDLVNTAYFLVRPDCRIRGNWVATLTGRTSGSGFWKDVAIYDRESLLDRDGDSRTSSEYSPEYGAPAVRYSMLQTASLPSFSGEEPGYMDVRFAAFDNRTMIGNFPDRQQQSSVPIVAATMVTDSLAAWVEAPIPGRQRHVIFLDTDADWDPFRETNTVPYDPSKETANPTVSGPDLILSDGSRFTAIDRAALQLDGWSLIPAPDRPVIYASNGNEEIWKLARLADEGWIREVMLIVDRPASIITVNGDGSLIALMLGGATAGDQRVAVVTVSEGLIVEYPWGSFGTLRTEGARDFVQEERNGPVLELFKVHYPDYAGYSALLEATIAQFCPEGTKTVCTK